ncbi:immunoglobulin domain-containing protein [Cerasicoccus fimbriatus]|uniref:immunoglobulin domain-containing protein n=1 Tax=Cerasicoccus fimbriatus TaxID=3014554 RepID=UPI0022B3EFC6|nr:immunoglobulin domain-containing protein [Cerasicoccus sp. TK19100]
MFSYATARLCSLLLALLLSTLSLSAASPYAGDYLGTLSINGTASGRLFLAIDSDGNFSDYSELLTGTTSDAGVITFDANDFGFTTATIDGNFSFVATGSANTLSYRLEGEKSAAVFSSPSLDDVLTQTNPLNYFAGATDLIWDGSQFVALTSQSIAVSNDGINWEVSSIGLTGDFTRIAYGNGVYVIIGDGNVVATSTDLDTWTLRSSGIPGLAQQNIEEVVFFNGRFWAVNIQYAYISSADGVSWTQETPFQGGFGGYSRMEVINGQLVVATTQNGNSANTVFYTSANGRDFTGPTAGVNIGGTPVSIVAGNGVILAASTGGLAISTDGVTFSRITSSLPASYPRAMVFDGTKFIAAWYNSFHTSTDGVSWTASTGPGGDMEAMAVNGSTVVAVGEEPFHSTDGGASWNATSTNALGSTQAYEVVAGNGVFLFQADGLNTFRSTDGETFTDIGLQLDGIGYGNGIFAAYDRVNDKLVYSVDGLEWFDAIVAVDPLYVSYGNVVFNGEVFYKNGLVSTDGINWDWAEDVSSFGSDVRRGGNGELINYGSGPTYQISLDNGKTFQGRNLSNQQAHAAAYGNGLWVMGFSSGYYAYGPSLDSLASGRYSEGVETPSIRSMNFLGDVFYGSLEDNRVILSTDGKNWVPKTLGANVRLVSSAQSGPLGIFTGDDATVFTVDLGGSFLRPFIVEQPVGVAADELDVVTLTASVGNSAGATYIWTKDGVPVANLLNVSGADTASITFDGIRADQAGDYRLIVVGPDGGAITEVATVTVEPLAVFTTQPQSATATDGGSVTFTSEVDDETATFQWYKNGVELPGETDSSLSLSGLTTASAGIYTVVATNVIGPQESLPAALSISAASGPTLNTSFMANVPDDAPFNNTRDTMYSFAEQGDKLIVGGYFQVTSSPRTSSLMRLNADGTRDTSYVGAQIEYSGLGIVEEMCFDDQGRLYIGGSYQFPGQGVGVYDTNGNLLKTFNTYYRVVDYKLLSYGTRMVVVANMYQFNSYFARGGIAEINTETLTHNTSFTSKVNTALGNFYPLGAAIQSNGKLVFFGYHGTSSSSPMKLMRLNTDGTKDTSFTESTFTGSGTLGGYELVLDDDENIFVLTNNVTHVGGVEVAYSRVQKFSPNGVLDPTFGAAQNGDTTFYRQMAYVGDRTLVLGYDEITAISTEDGSTLPINFGTGVPSAQYLGAIQGIQRVSDGFMVGGKFSSFDGQPTNGIAYYQIPTSTGPSLPLTIVQQPESVVDRLGQPGRLVVAATGSGLRYEWYHDGVLVDGEFSNQLQTDALTAGDSGLYKVIVYDKDDNFVESNEVSVSIPDAPVASSSFADWALYNLPPGSDFTLDGDLNNNGQPDGLDFIFGSGVRPTTGTQTGAQLGIGGDEEYLTFSVRRRRGATGLNISPKAAPTLAGLANGGSNVQQVSSAIDGEFEVITYRATFSIDATGAAFYMVTVAED